MTIDINTIYYYYEYNSIYKQYGRYEIKVITDLLEKL